MGVQFPQPLLIMKLKLNKKTIFVVIAIILIVILVWRGFIKKEKTKFSLAEVTRGTISQEVSETGTVEKGEQINLGFKNSGTIEQIYVKVGDTVKAGQSLIKLDTSQLQIQLQEAEANLLMSKAKLDKLLAGPSPEEIQLAETILDNAYKEALNYLNNAYIKTNEASLAVNLIQRTYFYISDPDGLTVRDIKEKIETYKNQMKSILDNLKINPTQEEIEKSISVVKSNLGEIINGVITIRDITENPLYRNVVSSTAKTSLDTQISNINTARSQLLTVEGTIARAKDELLIKKAPPREEDINLYKAQVEQAKAQIELLKNQISEATLKSPIAGIITEINKKIGETVQAALGNSVISLIPLHPFEIKVDIYEGDIVKIKIGNPVEISFVAFPEKIFKGKVANIKPTEKVKEGVVYYEVTIIPEEELPSEIKPGMTADVKIKTATKENVLIVPQEAIQEKDGKKIIQISKNSKNGKIEEREVEVGLKGNNDMIEIISGVQEGEKVLIK